MRTTHIKDGLWFYAVKWWQTSSLTAAWPEYSRISCWR